MLGFGEAKHDTPGGKHKPWGHEPFVHFNEQKAFKKALQRSIRYGNRPLSQWRSN